MMNQNMFCFQCEQTAGCSGCAGKKGVCGKTADNAKLQDELTGALIGLAKATQGREGLITKEIDQVMLEALFATVTNVSFDDDHIEDLIDRVYEAKGFLYPSFVPCTARECPYHSLRRCRQCRGRRRGKGSLWPHRPGR